MTNYVTLLDQLRRCKQREDPVLLATFNYDQMIEDALSSVGITINDLVHYIQNDAFKLFKLHGSVHWAREVETEIPNVTERNAWDLVNELIERVGDLKIRDRCRMVPNSPTDLQS
jgi:hypothetical protein